MTICIAAIGLSKSKEENIVISTDHMISLIGIGQFEHSITKHQFVGKQCVAMLAGNALFFPEVLKGINDNDPYKTVRTKIFNNFRTMRDEMIKKELLDIFKVDMEYLKKRLSGPVANKYVDGMLQAVAKFNLGTSVLITGFHDGSAHIAEINEFRILDMRAINFHAIGSGAVQAVNALLFQRHSKRDFIEQTIYDVYKAKRNAEVAIGVGKETDMLIITQKGSRVVPKEDLEALGKIYEEELDLGKNHESLKSLKVFTSKKEGGAQRDGIFRLF